MGLSAVRAQSGCAFTWAAEKLEVLIRLEWYLSCYDYSGANLRCRLERDEVGQSLRKRIWETGTRLNCRQSSTFFSDVHQQCHQPLGRSCVWGEVTRHWMRVGPPQRLWRMSGDPEHRRKDRLPDSFSPWGSCARGRRAARMRRPASRSACLGRRSSGATSPVQTRRAPPELVGDHLKAKLALMVSLLTGCRDEGSQSGQLVPDGVTAG